eukprot:s3054_g6.t1
MTLDPKNDPCCRGFVGFPPCQPGFSSAPMLQGTDEKRGSRSRSPRRGAWWDDEAVPKTNGLGEIQAPVKTEEEKQKGNLDFEDPLVI